MMAAEMKEPAGMGGSSEALNVLNVKSEYPTNTGSCQGVTGYPPYTPGQKTHLSMDAKAWLLWVRAAQQRGWTGLYSRTRVWGSFWYFSELPEVQDMLGRVAAAVAEVFPDERKLDCEDRRKYWASKQHPDAEVAAVLEVNGDKLTKDLEKEAASNRGEVPDAPDSKLVAHRCLQLGRQLAARGKKINEPAWFGALRVLAHCLPDLTREVSAGHDKFNEPEFQAKLERIRDEQLRPSTCNYFNSHNPAGCCGCTFTTLHSPIALGFENLPRPKRGAQ